MSATAFYKKPPLINRICLFTSAYARRYSGSSLRKLVASKLTHRSITWHNPAPLIGEKELQSALELPDFSEPSERPHAVNLMFTEVANAVSDFWEMPVTVHRPSRLISPEDNYDNLNFDAAAIARDRRQAKYVSDDLMLRTHMSATAPNLMRELAKSQQPSDVYYAMPGRVYRRDVVDRIHLAAPHQLDIWRFNNQHVFKLNDLESLAAHVVESVMPGIQWRLMPASHPYTHHGRQIDVLVDGMWLELGECGILTKSMLSRNGLKSTWSGIIIGIGLDRAVMIRKHLTDIRVVDSGTDPVEAELMNLNPVSASFNTTAERFYRHLPVAPGEAYDMELVGDQARTILGAEAIYLESIEYVIKPAPRGYYSTTDNDHHAVMHFVFSSTHNKFSERDADALFEQLQSSLLSA